MSGSAGARRSLAIGAILSLGAAFAIGSCADSIKEGGDAPIVATGYPGSNEDSDPWGNETGGDRAGVRKESGGANGDADYCNGTPRICLAGEGDCDGDMECAMGLVCASDNGGRFAATNPNFESPEDVCVPPTCLDRIVNGGEDPNAGPDCGGTSQCGSCTPNCSGQGANGHRDYCNYHCKCGVGEGDCDSTEACERGLVCKDDIGLRYGAPPDADFCVPGHCNDGVHNGDEDFGRIDCGGSCGPCICPGVNGDPGFCSATCPCASGAGDCDTDRECLPGLTCAEEGTIDRCRRYRMNVLAPSFDTAADLGVPGVQRATGRGDDTAGAIPLNGFAFRFFGNPVAQIFVSSNGTVDFSAPNFEHGNFAFPVAGEPGAGLIAPFWDDLRSDGAGTTCAPPVIRDLVLGSGQDALPAPEAESTDCSDVTYAFAGAAPMRRLVITWHNMQSFRNGGTQLGTFQVVLFETTDRIHFNYQMTQNVRDTSPTVGINQGDGLDALLLDSTELIPNASSRELRP